jgi:predicted nucleic acid-binding protein
LIIVTNDMREFGRMPGIRVENVTRSIVPAGNAWSK